MTELEKKINVLHIVGGKKSNGVFKGAYIFHEALLGLKINSKILNDENNKNIKNDNFVYINKNLYSKSTFFKRSDISCAELGSSMPTVL